ncbi:MAG: hypothetical protein KIC47_10235 [Clostridium sp.]|nr:hypothetical protein [Clostridium sp.]
MDFYLLQFNFTTSYQIIKELQLATEEAKYIDSIEIKLENLELDTNKISVSFNAKRVLDTPVKLDTIALMIK